MKRVFNLKSITKLCVILVSSIFLSGQLSEKPDLTREYVFRAGSDTRFSYRNVLQRGDKGKNYFETAEKYQRWKRDNAPKTGPGNTIRFMTYNVMAGAGAANPNPEDPDEYRLPKILKIIKAANPDILAIQEATDWDKLNPPVIQQVAEELQTNYYFLGKFGGGHPVAIFSKLEIKEAIELPDPFFFPRG